MTRSQLMKEAWKFARGIAKKLGKGEAYQYIAEGLRRAWAFYGKQVITKNKNVEKKKDFSNVVLRGRMTEKQERFIEKLLRSKTSDNPIAQAFKISSLRRTISKRQASQLIEELLSA